MFSLSLRSSWFFAWGCFCRFCSLHGVVLQIFFGSPVGLCDFRRRGLADQRLHVQRRDAVALLAQHAEAESVEREALPGLGDRTRLVNDQPRYGGRLLVREA